MQRRPCNSILACLLVIATPAALGGALWARAGTIAWGASAESSTLVRPRPPVETGAIENAAATTMYIETCSLGCSSGAGGNQISCGILPIHVNAEIDIQFSRPVDPASVSWSTFQIIDINTGQVPVGTRFVDPSDPTHVVFRPEVAVDANGQWVFGFHANTTYRIVIPGVAQGDSGPFITSTDAPALENQGRMQCDIQPSLGVQESGARYCFADGAATHCPCANSVNPAGGCPNSISASGASLIGVGSSSLSSDSLLLFASGMPNSLSVFLQGTSRANGGQGFVFGDGLRCIDGQVMRLAPEIVAASSSHYPSATDLPISVRGGVSTPGTRTYQVWYRDPTSFCAGARFNLTNALSVTWGP